MLRIRALRIPAPSRWVTQHRPAAAFMSSLPGMPPETPAGPSSSEPSPDAPRTQSATEFAESLRQITNIDATVREWDLSHPPVGPATAYPPPNPTNPVRKAAAPEELKHYGLYVKATRNNTITTVTDPLGGKLKTYSGGICGFKGHRRSGFEAGYQCAVRAIEYLQNLKSSNTRVNLYLNGFGQGREAIHKALIASDGAEVRRMISSVTDITPMKIGGTRAKKRRRL